MQTPRINTYRFIKKLQDPGINTFPRKERNHYDYSTLPFVFDFLLIKEELVLFSYLNCFDCLIPFWELIYCTYMTNRLCNLLRTRQYSVFAVLLSQRCPREHAEARLSAVPYSAEQQSFLFMTCIIRLDKFKAKCLDKKTLLMQYE